MNRLDSFCFTSAARTKSFSITARELRISQQAVSKHIRNLEEELGYQLFFRDAGSVRLTTAGKYMLQYLSEQDALIEEMHQQFYRPETSSELTIAFSQWVGCPACFSGLIRSFRESHETAEFHLLNLDAEETFSLLKDETIDMLLTTRYMSQYLPVPWKAIPLFTTPLYMVRSLHTIYNAEQLNLYPFYAPCAGEISDNAIILRVRSTCRKLGFSPQHIIPCHDMGTVMLNLLLNNGITIGACAEDMADIHDFCFDQTDLSAEIVICVPHQIHSPLLKEFLETIHTSGSAFFVPGGSVNE